MKQDAARRVHPEPRVQLGVRQRTQDELANRPQGFLNPAEVRELDVARDDGLEGVRAAAVRAERVVSWPVADAAGFVPAPAGEVVVEEVVAEFRLDSLVLLVVHAPVAFVAFVAPVVAALLLLQAPGAGERDGRDVASRRRVHGLLPSGSRGRVPAGALVGRRVGCCARRLTLRRERALRGGGDDVRRRERRLLLPNGGSAVAVRVPPLGSCGVELLQILIHLERGIPDVRAGLVHVHAVAVPFVVIRVVIRVRLRVVIRIVGSGARIAGPGSAPSIALGDVRRLHRLERVAAGVGPGPSAADLLARALHHLAEDVRGLAEVLAVDAAEVLHGRGDVGRVAPVLGEFLDSRDEALVAAGGVAAAAPGPGAGRPAVLPRGLTLELTHRCRGPLGRRGASSSDQWPRSVPAPTFV